MVTTIVCDGICDGQSEGYVNGRDSELNGSKSTSINLARIQSLADWDPAFPYAPLRNSGGPGVLEGLLVA